MFFNQEKFQQSSFWVVFKCKPYFKNSIKVIKKFFFAASRVKIFFVTRIAGLFFLALLCFEQKSFYFWQKSILQKLTSTLQKPNPLQWKILLLFPHSFCHLQAKFAHENWFGMWRCFFFFLLSSFNFCYRKLIIVRKIVIFDTMLLKLNMFISLM